MSSVNECILLGRVGNDPEIRATSGGNRIAKVSLATSRKYNGNETTQWHRLTFFGKLVDVVEKYVAKGDQLYVRGRIEYSTVGEGESKKFFTDIVVNDLTLIGRGRVDPTPEPAKRGTGMDAELPFAPLRLTNPLDPHGW